MYFLSRSNSIDSK